MQTFSGSAEIAAPGCVTGAGYRTELLFQCPGVVGLTACLHSVLCAHSCIQPVGRLGNASLCVQIFVRISVDFFTFARAICLCFLKVFFVCFSSTFTFIVNASLATLLWHMAYLQEHDADERHSFTIILLQVISENLDLCQCLSVVLGES